MPVLSISCLLAMCNKYKLWSIALVLAMVNMLIVPAALKKTNILSKALVLTVDRVLYIKKTLSWSCTTC